MAYGVIYLLRNLRNGKGYIGQTTQPPEMRLRQHLKSKRMHCKALVAAIAKYGPDAFEFLVLSTAATKQELDDAEVKAITNYGTMSPAGYNLREGGSWGTHSAESRRAISAANKGKTISEEQLRGMSERMLGTSPSLETRAKISAKLTGRKMPPEVCEQMSIRGFQRHIDNPFTDESKALMSRNRSGIPVSEERKRHLSVINTGKTHTEETKAVMSASQTERWRLRKLLKNNQQKS